MDGGLGGAYALVEGPLVAVVLLDELERVVEGGVVPHVVELVGRVQAQHEVANLERYSMRAAMEEEEEEGGRGHTLLGPSAPVLIEMTTSHLPDLASTSVRRTRKSPLSCSSSWRWSREM